MPAAALATEKTPSVWIDPWWWYQGSGLIRKRDVEDVRAHLDELRKELERENSKRARSGRVAAIEDFEEYLSELAQLESQLGPGWQPSRFEHVSRIVSHYLDLIEGEIWSKLDRGWNEPDQGLCWRNFSCASEFAYFAFYEFRLIEHLLDAAGKIVQKSSGPLPAIVFEVGEWASVAATWHLVAFKFLCQISFDRLNVPPTRPLLTQVRELRSRVLQERLLVADVQPPAEASRNTDITISPDFASVNWKGTQYRFNERQARVFKALWNARERGTPALSGKHLCKVAVADLREQDPPGSIAWVFRNHPAWRTLILPLEQPKGTVELAG